MLIFYNELLAEVGPPLYGDFISVLWNFDTLALGRFSLPNNMNIKKDELAHIAQEILKQISVPRTVLGSKAAIVALRGDLGAGKTTFTQALAKELGIEDAVQSPTYVLMKSYPINPPAGGDRFKKLIHIDAYRLDKPEEFDALEPDTFLNNPENLVVIEWPERVEGVLPTPDLLINFTHTDSEEERHIEIDPTSHKAM